MSDKQHYDYFQSRDNRDFYFAGGYPRQNMIFSKLKRFVKKGSKILEIGFGDGYLLHLLKQYGYSIIGQDISQDNIDITKEKLGLDNASLVLGDESGNILSGDNSLDAYISSEVLEHMDDKELRFHITEIHRALKKGGYAFITFPAEEDLKKNECFCPNCKTLFHKVGHKQSFNDEKITTLFDDFTILTKKRTFTKYVGKTRLEKTAGWVMYILRTVLDKVIRIDNATYLLIIKK